MGTKEYKMTHTTYDIHDEISMNFVLFSEPNYAVLV